MLKDFYIVSIKGDAGKKFYLYKDKTIAWKAYMYENEEMDEDDEYFYKFENEEDEVKADMFFNSVKEFFEYVKANDINIVEEYEVFAF